MSVLVKGCKMPISCADCFLEDAYEGYNCRIAQKSANWGLGGRPSWCPLVEAPEWISVEERLPEKTGKYLVCGQWRGKPAETWVCEFIALGRIKGWVNEARNPVVTHWMPLPLPPKEDKL